MNLIGHQSGVHNTPSDGILHGLAEGRTDDFPDALLRAYPFLEEEHDPGVWLYSKHLCTRHPLLESILFDLIDELADVFEADAMHIGCDESFGLGTCPRCRGIDTGELFADHVNRIASHLRERGMRTMIWSDRLIDAARSGYNDMYESAFKGAQTAISRLGRDVICCDWHYNDYAEFKSVDIFADEGFGIMISPWRYPEQTGHFLDYAVSHDRGHILGYLQTTWCSSGELARHYLYGEAPKWDKTPSLISVLDEYFLLPPRSRA